MEIYYINSEKFLKNVDKESLYYFASDKSSKSEKRKTENSLGRFLVHWVLSCRYDIKSPEITVFENKPFLVNGNIKFSISHTNGFVMAAFDEFDIGLDIEIMKDRDFKAIYRHMKIKTSDFSKETFFRFWTEYEAEIKLKSECKSTASFRFFDNYIVSLKSSHSFDIKNKLKIYELTNPTAKTNPSELINLKLVRDSRKNENALVAQEMSTAFSEFFEPLNLKTE